jgi:hypothetical protein
MTSRFVPVQAVPGNPGFTLPIPIQVNPPLVFGTRPTAPVVEREFGFGTPEGRAWALLLLRAAYLDNFQFTVTAAGYRDGLVNVERLQGAAFGEYRITLVEYLSTILCVFHGVRNRASVQQVALDMLTPRLTGGLAQFLATGGLVGQAVLDVLDGGRWSAKPRASIAHSFGGVIASWIQAQIPDTHPFLGMMTFGTPKIGQQNAPASFNHDTVYCYGAVDDPFIGLPPSYIRLPEVAALVAVWPLPAAAAQVVKTRIDAIWSTFRSITPEPMAIGEQGELTRMSDVDSGRAWYNRTNFSVSGIVTSLDTNPVEGHKASTYYNRCRASFPTWTTLNQAAGPAGRNADVLALALTAAESTE